MRNALIAALTVLLLAAPTLAEDAAKALPAGEGPPRTGRPTGSVLAFTLGGGAVYQGNTDLEEGGEFHVSRYFIQPGVSAFLGPKLQLSLNLGYGFDQYRFSGSGGISGTKPWEDVESVRLSVFGRYVLDEEWTLFGAPAVRWSAERDASLSDGFTYGLFAGASWKASETLSIGPGAGYFSEIEDSGTVFPILLIDWKFAENWAVRTGKGLAATRGPGLTVAYEFADQWSLELGGRWEQFRFRLDRDGVADRGVGEEASLPVYLALSYQPAPRSTISLIAGVNLAGRVRLYDDDGHKLASEDYDPAPFVGLAFSLTF